MRMHQVCSRNWEGWTRLQRRVAKDGKWGCNLGKEEEGRREWGATGYGS